VIHAKERLKKPTPPIGDEEKLMERIIAAQSALGPA
jgi:hypothetical protein